MIRIPIVALLAAATLAVATDAGASLDDGADAIAGRWRIERDGEPHHEIAISREGEAFVGTIVWLPPDAMRLDARNEDPALRDRPLLGLRVLWGYTHAGGDRWSGGEFYAFEKGRTVSPELELATRDRLEMRVRFLFITKTLVWHRVTGKP